MQGVLVKEGSEEGSLDRRERMMCGDNNQVTLQTGGASQGPGQHILQAQGQEWGNDQAV